MFPSDIIGNPVNSIFFMADNNKFHGGFRYQKNYNQNHVKYQKVKNWYILC